MADSGEPLPRAVARECVDHAGGHRLGVADDDAGYARSQPEGGSRLLVSEDGDGLAVAERLVDVPPAAPARSRRDGLPARTGGYAMTDRMC